MRELPGIILVLRWLIFRGLLFLLVFLFRGTAQRSAGLFQLLAHALQHLAEIVPDLFGAVIQAPVVSRGRGAGQRDETGNAPRPPYYTKGIHVVALRA